MKRVLVTGGSGFVGRHSLGPLGALGYEVHAVGNRPDVGGPARWHRANLLVRSEVDRLLDEVEPTHLLHFAWYGAHGKFWSSAENLSWVESSLALLRGFVERGGRRAVLAGSCAEYDWRFGFCSEEATPRAPATLYGVSKNALREVASSYAATVGLSLAWGRIFFLYGPDEQAGRLVPSVIRGVAGGEVVRCTHGEQARDFLHVADCAEGFVALVESGVEGAVNVASGRPLAIRSLVARITELIPGDVPAAVEFGAIPVAPDDPPLIVADVRRMGREVGWSPRIDLTTGLTETIRSMTGR